MEVLNATRTNADWVSAMSNLDAAFKYRTKVYGDIAKMSTNDIATCTLLMGSVEASCDEEPTKSDGCCDKDCADSLTALIANTNCFKVMLGSLKSTEGAAYRAPSSRMIYRCTGNTQINSAFTAAPKLLLGALAVFAALLWF
jgi:hypothetical protein